MGVRAIKFRKCVSYELKVRFILMDNWASEASPTLTSTIEIEIPTRANIYIYIYIYVQKNVWHAPEGKCHVLRMRRRMLWYRVARPLT